MNRTSILGLCVAALVAFVSIGPGMLAQAAELAGQVTKIKGNVEALTEGDTRRLGPASPVYRKDQITTGKAARLEVTLGDGTVLTLSEQAKLVITEFVYESGGSKNAIAIAATGAFRFISGAVAKARPSAVAIKTPVAELGIRGTDFWSGPIDGHYGVLLLKGAVEVSNAQGTVLLDDPGEGTNIAGPDAAPGAVAIWPQDKVERALAAVAF